MPLHNQIVKHITDADKAAVNEEIDKIDVILRNYVVNLTPEERQKYGSIDEKNKLFANKVMDYHRSEPSLCSPEVDCRCRTTYSFQLKNVTARCKLCLPTCQVCGLWPPCVGQAMLIKTCDVPLSQ